MSWQLQWQSISRRIGGFLGATAVFTALFQATNGEKGVSGRYEYINCVLLPQARDIFAAIDGLCRMYGKVLPSPTAETVQFYSGQLQGASISGLAGLLGSATILASIKSELDYILADQEAVTVAAVERAFEHLQRTIAVDADQCKRWQAGFMDKETQCERMGAAHLLWHGIWAFKVNTEGERTDLVLGTSIGESVIGRVQATGSRLVLTEWKLVRDQSSLMPAIKKAVTQLKLYSQGGLAGVELQSVLYMVVVSEGRLVMPEDHHIGNRLCRFVNIVTSPPPPSRS